MGKYQTGFKRQRKDFFCVDDNGDKLGKVKAKAKIKELIITILNC